MKKFKLIMALIITASTVTAGFAETIYFQNDMKTNIDNPGIKQTQFTRILKNNPSSKTPSYNSDSYNLHSDSDGMQNSIMNAALGGMMNGASMMQGGSASAMGNEQLRKQQVEYAQQQR